MLEVCSNKHRQIVFDNEDRDEEGRNMGCPLCELLDKIHDEYLEAMEERND